MGGVGDKGGDGSNGQDPSIADAGGNTGSDSGGTTTVPDFDVYGTGLGDPEDPQQQNEPSQKGGLGDAAEGVPGGVSGGSAATTDEEGNFKIDQNAVARGALGAASLFSKGNGITDASIPAAFLPLLDLAIETQRFGLSQGLDAMPSDLFFNPDVVQDQVGRADASSRGFARSRETGARTFQAGLEGLTSLATGNATQNVLDGVAARLQPIADRQKEFGAAEIAEQANALGVARSSGTVESIGRHITGIDAGIQQVLGEIEGKLAPVALSQQGQAAHAALQVPSAFDSTTRLPIQQALQESQFARGLAAPVGSAAGALGNSVPVIPPIVGPNPMASALQTIAPLFLANGGSK